MTVVDKNRKQVELSRTESASCYYSRLHTALWLLAGSSYYLGQSREPQYLHLGCEIGMSSVQSSFQEAPESMGQGRNESPESALCSPTSKMSTLPTCLSTSHLRSCSWQDFSQQKVDPAFSQRAHRMGTDTTHPALLPWLLSTVLNSPQQGAQSPAA